MARVAPLARPERRTPTGRRKRAAASLVVTLIGALLFASAATAATTTRTFVTLLTTPGDYVGGGDHRLFHPGNAQIWITGDAGEFTISASGGTLGDTFGLTFAAPRGQKLHPGFYPEAQRAPFREGLRPGLNVSGAHRGCNRVAGHFDVKDIATGDDGRVERLWLTFEQHCEEGPSALVGEVQFALPAPATRVIGAPRLLEWPALHRGAPGLVLPVTFVVRGSAPVALGQAVVGGPHRADFPIRLNECRGTALFRGESCRVWVRFRPHAAGPRFARMLVQDASGRAYGVDLSGYGIAGRTRFLLRSERGDWVGAGRRYAYKPSNATFALNGSRAVVHAEINGADGRWWQADFAAPAGDILAPGTYRNALRFPFNQSAPGLDISGTGRGCNHLEGSFTVTTLRTGLDGSVRSFGARFEQHCDGRKAALRGILEYRIPVGDVTPPSRVTRVVVKRVDGRARLSWVNPSNRDFAMTIVRFLRSAWPPASPTSGFLAHAGPGRSTIVTAAAAEPLSFALYPLDRTGNVGRPVFVVSKPAP